MSTARWAGSSNTKKMKKKKYTGFRQFMEKAFATIVGRLLISPVVKMTAIATMNWIIVGAVILAILTICAIVEKTGPTDILMP